MVNAAGVPAGTRRPPAVMVTTGTAVLPAMVTVAVFTGPTLYDADCPNDTTISRSGFTVVDVLVVIVTVRGLLPGGERHRGRERVVVGARHRVAAERSGSPGCSSPGPGRPSP